MQHVLAPPPRLQLDAKRILATSGAIAVHVAILMMLLMPAPVATPQAQEEVIVVPVDPVKQELPKITPPPPIEKPKPQPVQQTPRQATPIPDEQVDPVDQTVSPVDKYVPEVIGPPKDFRAVAESSPFQQLTTDMAPAPPYPRMALQRGVAGTVTLRIHVDATGRPIEVSVEKSSGSRILDEAALKFVQNRWHFVPAQSNGQAIDAWALVPIEFVLN
jgi:protein TonB